MKSCPTCNRTFEDTLTYCLIDGSILSAPFDPQATLTMREPGRIEPPPTEILQPKEGARAEIPPTVASSKPEQKPEESASTIAAPPPSFEAPQMKDSPARPARKSKKSLAIIGAAVGLLIIATTAAVFYFSKSNGYRIADVWLFNLEGKRTTRFKPNDEIRFSVEVRPEDKTGSLMITKRLFLIKEHQSFRVIDIDPALPALTGNPTSFPLRNPSEAGKYRLEVVLHDANKELDTKTVEFEIARANSNETGNVPATAPSPSPVPVMNFEGTTWEFTRDGRYKESFVFQPGGKVTRRFETIVQNGTWTIKGNRLFIQFPEGAHYSQYAVEGDVEGERISGEYVFSPQNTQSFTARRIK